MMVSGRGYLTGMLIADQYARKVRLARGRSTPWQPIAGHEPSYEAIRDQFSAELAADFDGLFRSEISPAKESSQS